MSSFLGLPWYVHLVNTLLSIASPAFYYCEAATPSSANLSSTYTIIPSDYEQNFHEVILQSPNGSFQLMFGNLPARQSNPHSLGIVHVASTPNTLVWYTHRNNNPGLSDNLGGTSTTLELGKSGNLAIHVTGNGVNILVWNTGTSGMGVVGMALREEGNLVLLNSSKGVVWQSFEHPTDTLLANQKLFVGKSLLGSARNGFPSVGRNILVMESDRLVSYVIYVDPEPYWELSTKDNKELAYASIVNGSISVFDKNGHIVASRGNSSSISGGEGSLQRFSLADDGNMRLYKFDNARPAWIQQMQVIEEACALPDDCGYYGLCIPGQGCACPPTFESLTTLSGCVPARGLVCNSRYGKDFVKVPAASYFAAGLTTIPNLSFTACQSLCTNNCSCLGFFYGVGGGSSRQCLITHQMRTFSASIYGNYTEKYAYDSYVRVQGRPRSRLAVIVCILVAGILFCLALCGFVRYEQRIKVAHGEEEFLLEALPGLPPRYSYRELKKATNNFTQRIGEGSFGSVYEGVLADGSRVAVKRLEGDLQGKKEFHAEVATIGTVRHVNLVRLKGFCLERKHRLLVYEHMARGSLAGLLFGREAGKEKLTWEDRLAMALDVARGLAFLHHGSPDRIIHCDIKPENILVNDDGVAKLSDFGLAKPMSRQLAYCETNVRGTRGYLAPEWLTGRRQITEKADVFSYGVVLLEMLSGRRNFDLAAGSNCGSYLPEWALEYLTTDGNIGEILDPNLSNVDGAGEGLDRACIVALWCVQEDPTMRPGMNRVVRMLEGDVGVAMPPRPPWEDATVFCTRSSPMAFETERLANSEVAMPFLLHTSRFLHLSSTPQMPPKASSMS